MKEKSRVTVGAELPVCLSESLTHLLHGSHATLGILVVMMIMVLVLTWSVIGVTGWYLGVLSQYSWYWSAISDKGGSL